MKCCINGTNFIRLLILCMELFKFKIQKCGQILCANKTYIFSHAGSHTYIVYGKTFNEENFHS